MRKLIARVIVTITALAFVALAILKWDTVLEIIYAIGCTVVALAFIVIVVWAFNVAFGK